MIVSVLFLMVLSLLALSILEVNLLENKMSGFFYDKVNSFYLAEGYLLQAEEQIGSGSLPTNGHVECDQLPVDNHKSGLPCEVACYRLKATAEYHGSTSILWSTFLRIGDTSGCKQQFKRNAGRQSFCIER